MTKVAGAIRPAWDTYFMNIAQTVATRADCTRARVGAVIVNWENRIVSTGYNGSEPGGPSCLKGECPRGQLSSEELAHLTPDYSNCISLHAEMNAIAYSSREDTLNGTMYCTLTPCDMCSKLIKASGITRVVTPNGEYHLS
jgi:dCMP deaminase